MWINLASLWTLMSVSFILLSTTPTATTASPPASTWDPRLLHDIEEAANWIDTSESVEKKAPGEPCDAPPSLSYLRSQIKHLLVYRSQRERGSENASTKPWKSSSNSLSSTPSTSRTSSIPTVPNSPKQTFLDQQFEECVDPENCICSGTWDMWDTAVCLPNSDTTTEGRCVYCTVLQEEITNGTLKSETTIECQRCR
jgi:hypothetical protein